MTSKLTLQLISFQNQIKFCQQLPVRDQMIWALHRLLSVETDRLLGEISGPLDVPGEIEFTRTLRLLQDLIHDLIFQQVFSEKKGYHPPVIIDVSKGEPSRDYELAERSSRLSRYRGDSESGDLIGPRTDSSTSNSDIDSGNVNGLLDEDQLGNFSDDNRTLFSNFSDPSDKILIDRRT